MNAPFLALPNFNEEFTIETNVSAQGVRVDLSQAGMPIAFMSKLLLDRNVAFLIYVLDKGFKIKTNH